MESYEPGRALCRTRATARHPDPASPRGVLASAGRASLHLAAADHILTSPRGKAVDRGHLRRPDDFGGHIGPVPCVAVAAVCCFTVSDSGLPARVGMTTGPRGCWPPSWGCRTQSPGCGESTLQPWRAQSFRFSTDPHSRRRSRRGESVPQSSGQGRRAVCRSETPAQALERAAPVLPLRPGIPKSAGTITSGTARLRCSPRWRSPPARSPTPATPGTGTRNSCVPEQVPGPFRAWPLRIVADDYGTHKHPMSGPGWPGTPGSPCTSRQRRGPGSTGEVFRSPPGRPYAAAASPRSRTSSPRSGPLSTAGTTAASHSSGPRPPTI